MTISTRLMATATVLAFLTGPVLAQTPATSTPPAKTTPDTKTAPETKTKTPRTAESLECSKEADAKGLHGKERHKFRSECKKSATKAN
jgi:hypothetical protein